MSSDKITVIDLGKQKRSKVKKLTNGTGPLAEEILASVEHLRQAGEVAATAEVVVVVVEKKAKSTVTSLFG